MECRVCRNLCEYPKCHLITSFIDGIEVKSILSATLLINFSDLNFPQSICQSCFEATKKVFELQKIAIESDKYFRTIFCDEIKTELFDELVEVKIEECEPEEVPQSLSRKRINHKSSYNPRLAAGSDEFYECNFCEKVLKPKKNMLTHLKSHDPKLMPYGCHKCIKRFDSEKKLESHLKNHQYNSKSIFQCDECGVTGSRKEGMKNHMLDDHLCRTKKIKITSNSETFKCSLCDMELPDKREKNRHFLIVHEKIIRELKPDEVEINLNCIKCEQVHDDFSIHEDNFKTFKCTFCGLQIKDFANFLRHSKFHSQQPTHKCLRCDRNFVYDRTLTKHIHEHRRNEKLMIDCPSCELKFKIQKDFERHFRLKHKMETLQICPICAKSYASKLSLDEHIKYVHNKELNFQCRFCSKKFAVKKKLERHETTHSSDRPHSCEICSFKFKHIDALKKHMKRHKGGIEKNFPCSQCDFKFTTADSLKRHILTHSGLKPHECTYCEKAFTSKGDLIKHMRKLHVGDAIYQCPQCPRAFPLLMELREHQGDHLNT